MKRRCYRGTYDQSSSSLYKEKKKEDSRPQKIADGNRGDDLIVEIFSESQASGIQNSGAYIFQSWKFFQF
ncbi:hypothetical protein L6164_025561 [Bauhinia variegata]|uniref:Uncharacterized protein n=1 Tax=Bauhinia variegata TaxID=167791 RepID=A0ACB9M0Y8_BAUVA|nr:hypothetical protein L6164_025561 [Bauhinia variegata]